jgi:biopolymer transport protein ExbB
VLAYNVLGRLVRQISEELDGFAHDLHAYTSGVTPRRVKNAPVQDRVV